MVRLLMHIYVIQHQWVNGLLYDMTKLELIWIFFVLTHQQIFEAEYSVIFEPSTRLITGALLKSCYQYVSDFQYCFLKTDPYHKQ